MNENHSKQKKTSLDVEREKRIGVLTPIPFGEYLCSRDLLSEEQLLEALCDHWSNGGNIGAAICRQGFIAREIIEQEAKIFHSLDLIEV